jgi:hypothetical protein
MAVPLRVLAGRRQLAISQASFLPGGAERSDLLIFRVNHRARIGPQDARMWIAGRGYKAGRFTYVGNAALPPPPDIVTFGKPGYAFLSLGHKGDQLDEASPYLSFAPSLRFGARLDLLVTK